MTHTLEAKDIDNMTPEDTEPHFALVKQMKQKYQFLLWSFICHDWRIGYDVLTDRGGGGGSLEK